MKTLAARQRQIRERYAISEGAEKLQALATIAYRVKYREVRGLPDINDVVSCAIPDFDWVEREWEGPYDATSIKLSRDALIEALLTYK